MVAVHKISIKQACLLLSLTRSVYYVIPNINRDKVLIEELTILAEQHPSYGIWKMCSMLRKKGFKWNHKRVYRVYKLLKMNLHRRSRKRLPSRVKTPLLVPQTSNQIWSMDFMSDSLHSSSRFRTLNIIDDYNREVLSIAINTSIPSYEVVERLKLVIKERGKPMQIRVDNGPEFISSTFINFCNEKKIEVKHIQPGKPMQNGFIERFNRSYRTEILDAYIFYSISQVRILTDQWMEHYNNSRPHDALNDMSPIEYRNTNTLLKKDNSPTHIANKELSPFQQ